MHTWEKENLDICVEQIKNNMNFNVMISGHGKTRTGKTTKGIQTAAYLDKTFLDNWRTRIVYDWELLISTANSLKPGQAIIYDEARDVLNSAHSMSSYCQRLLTFFSRCGSKNLFIIVILPDFFDLPKSLAVVQSHMLIDCYFKNGFQRGFFNFFNDNQKKYLYLMGKRDLNYDAAKPSFQGTFTKWFPLSYEEYEEHKQKEFERIANKTTQKSENSRSTVKQKQRVKVLIDHIQKNEGLTQDEIAEILHLSRPTVSIEYFSNVKGQKRDVEGL